MMKTNNQPPNQTGAEIVAGALVFVAVLVVLIALSLAAVGASCEARGASSITPELASPKTTSASRLTTRASPASPAICRIKNQLGSTVDLGSGTLVEKNHDGTRGIVLTCGHLFSDGVGRVTVTFPNGATHGARLIDVDHQADLAALLIANPAPQPIEVATVDDDPTQLYRSCGYGASGCYRCVTGPMIGTSQSRGQMSMRIEGAVRSGDSGGAVLNSRGELVAVVWGQADGVSYASFGGPLQRFLGRVVGRRVVGGPLAEAQLPQSIPPGKRNSCPSGTCPLVRPRGPLPNRKPVVEPSRLDMLAGRIDALEAGKQDRGNYLTNADLSRIASLQDLERIENEATTRHTTLLSQIAQLATQIPGELASASGTPAWAMLAATAIAGCLFGRALNRRSRGAGGRRKRWFQLRKRKGESGMPKT